jgi:hypothetical protein
MSEGTLPGNPGVPGRPGESAADGWQPRQIVALATVAVTALMASLPISLPVPVLPQIARDIHSSTTSTEWLLTSTLLGAAIAVPIAGRLGDLYGKKLMLLAATFFLTVVRLSYLCAEPQPDCAGRRPRRVRPGAGGRAARHQPDHRDAARPGRPPAWH